MLSAIYTVPFAAPFDPAIVEIVCCISMYRACLGRPEYFPVASNQLAPFEKLYALANQRLEDIRMSKRNLTRYAVMARNSGGQFKSNNPTAATPFYFLADPNTGDGGFNSGSF